MRILIGPFATILFFLLAFNNSQAATSQWINYSELKLLAGKLKNDGQMMDRLECYTDTKTKKRIFKARYKKNPRKREWQWAVAGSVLSLHKKYISQGYSRTSLSSVIGSTKFQCGVWARR